MNAERLLAAFSNIGDNPDRIKQLRKIIVALAMSGRLNRGSATMSPSQLLRAVAQARANLIQLGAIPKATKRAEVTAEQLPEDFTNPTRFAPLGEIARIEKGLTGIQQALPGPFPLVVTAAERSSCDHYDFEGAAAIIPLVSSTGHGKASLHRLHYQEGQFALGTILTAVFPHDPTLFSARFIFEYLSAFKDELLVSRMTGTANVTLTVGRIAEVPVPLICPDVQRRIDELMARCDRLGTARQAREAARDKLTSASLARLNAPDLETFQADTRFALDALPALTARPDQVKQLRQTIVNLAVRGKLVPQDPNDEPASELLKQIDKRRAQLLKSEYPNPDEARTQIKKLAEQSVPEDLENLANGWAWATLMQCSALVIDCKNKTAPYASSGIRLIRTTNVRDGRMNLNDQKYVDQRTYEIWSARCRPEPGDILITREAPMGEVCLIPPGEQICLGQRMMLARLVPNTVNPNFMIYSLRDAKLMDRVQDKPIGATVQHLRVGGVETLLVPLPPLAEQRRIVAKVDELMALCDRLEASLATADETRRRLLESLLAEALAPDAERELEAAE
jgi:type I restriction enzyme S subunit